MIGSGQLNRTRNKRSRAVPAVTPVTRAIRVALATFVLAAPVVGMAAMPRNAVATAVNAMHARQGESAFADMGFTTPVVDLTLVRDEAVPASVQVSQLSAVANSTDIACNGMGTVICLDVVDAYSATFDNTAVISVEADASGTGMAGAYGVMAQAGLDVAITNDVDGVIDAVASSQDGYALAVGAYAIGPSFSTLDNYGAISAQATSVNGTASAYAAVIEAGYVGIGVLINGGDLDASASAAGDAHATAAFVVADVASIFNDHHAAATATTVSGEAVAIGAAAYGRTMAIYNYGDLTAEAFAGDGTAIATGADAFGYTSSVFYNAGDIGASAIADGGIAKATGASSKGLYASYATNLGAIVAVADGGQASATGVFNASMFDAGTYNAGSITASATGSLAPYGQYEAVAFGVYNTALYYDSVIDNSGSISVSASSTSDIGGTDGFLVAKALGAVSVGTYGYGETRVANAGDITAFAETSQGYAGAWGAVGLSGLYGTSVIDNDGLISVYAHTGIGSADAMGAYAFSTAGITEITNDGDIVASSRAERGIVNVTVNFSVATGVQAMNRYGAGESTVDNFANIEAHASVLGGIAYATGVYAVGSQHAQVNNAEGARILAAVDIELLGGGFATGIDAIGGYGVDVVNSGDVIAYGHANAYSDSHYGFYGAANAKGIAALGIIGDVAVTNDGDISAIAISEHSLSWGQGGASAIGIDAFGYGEYAVDIANTGNITAIADAEFGTVSAHGAISDSKYSGQIVNAAGASIVASASTGSLYADQYPGFADTFGVLNDSADYASIYNAGSIVAHAEVTPDGSEAWIGSIAFAFGSAIGHNDNVDLAVSTNVGSIEATASADFGYSTAYGSFVRSQYDTAVANAGDIVASASATGGNAFAVGSYAFSLHATRRYNCDYSQGYRLCDYANPIVEIDDGHVLSYNSGDIVAMASAQGGEGYSYGAVVLGGLTAGMTNAGHITAVTDADDALAVGALANSLYGDAMLQNSGVITARGTGEVANANGVVVHGLTSVQVDNTGAIAAGAYGADATAIAVSMVSDGSSSLTNTGTISAFGDGERIAISSAGSAGTTLLNEGAIVGAIRTADSDDSLDNAAGATWLAVGESDFGAGDDRIVNHGVIVMDDAAIRLGGYASGNVFANFGTIAVSGAANVLDMDNPFPVNNNGVISFLDGAADDALTVVGDLGGEGTLNVDVSGASQASDRLHVESNVIASTTQTVNVTVLDMPTTPTMHVDIADVLGDSTAANFVLGTVTYAETGFVSMDVRLNADMDASNARADAFYLGFAVTGLNDTGVLAASLAPGAQSLVNAQVGTWRQRMGVVPATPGKSGLAPWVRGFTDSGNVNPGATSNFGAGGNFGFDQSTHGWEMGLDARPTDQFAVGVLFADTEGTQDLRTGIGSTRLDGKTFGLYGTWMSNGAYVDISQRWVGIDASLRSTTGTNTTSLSADSFNIEAGFTAWTVSGLHVVPQAQYTRTRVSDLASVESGSSTFASDGGNSSRGRLGVSLDQTFERAGFTWTPYGSLNAVREFDGEYAYAINGGLLGTTSTQGTSAMVELGLGAQKDTLSITGGVNWLDGGAMDHVIGGQVVVRYSW